MQVHESRLRFNLRDIGNLEILGDVKYLYILSSLRYRHSIEVFFEYHIPDHNTKDVLVVYSTHRNIDRLEGGGGGGGGREIYISG